MISLIWNVFKTVFHEQTISKFQIQQTKKKQLIFTPQTKFHTPLSRLEKFVIPQQKSPLLMRWTYSPWSRAMVLFRRQFHLMDKTFLKLLPSFQKVLEHFEQQHSALCSVLSRAIVSRTSPSSSSPRFPKSSSKSTSTSSSLAWESDLSFLGYQEHGDWVSLNFFKYIFDTNN